MYNQGGKKNEPVGPETGNIIIEKAEETIIWKEGTSGLGSD